MRPDHVPTLGPDQWWACDHPERPYEPYNTVYYVEGCPRCRIAFEAMARQYPNELIQRRDDKLRMKYETTATEALQEMRELYTD